MKLQIDNLDGAGARDYSADIDASRTPRVTRKLNEASELRFSLISIGGNFIVPVQGGRVTLGRLNGQDVFTGYIVAVPEFEYLGWGERGPMYRYNFVAKSDEVLLDEKRLPSTSPFVARSAGDALRQLTQDALPGALDVSAVQDLDPLPYYVPDPQLSWAQHAAAIATEARACYRTVNGALTFAPVGAAQYSLDEFDPNFSPQALTLLPAGAVLNDVTIVGDSEPQDWVRDYFVGDGLTSRYHLSQTPFTKGSRTVFDEEYAGSSLDATRWTSANPTNAISLGSGRLQVAGGNGNDGATLVTFVEKVELAAATLLQHGDVVFKLSVHRNPGRPVSRSCFGTDLYRRLPDHSFGQ
jgi:hypothetical protein